MNARRTLIVAALTVAGALLATATPAQTTTYEVREGEVIAVSGNDLVVKTAEGYREIFVPEDFRFLMNGEQLSVHQLKPGMKLTAAIATTRTPLEIVTTELRDAEVINANGMSVVVKDQNGEQKIFTEKDFTGKGLAIYKNGQPATAFDLRKGDRVTALIMKEGPPLVLEEKRITAVAQNPAPPARTLPASSPAQSPPPPPRAATSTPAEPAKTLPKTASPWPLLGLAGLLLLGAGGVATIWRRRLV